MTKLLKTYFNKPTLENAQRIVAHTRKHPMAACMLTAYDHQILQDAVAHTKNTLNYPTQRVQA
jgi:hypothetical protein